MQFEIDLLQFRWSDIIKINLDLGWQSEQGLKKWRLLSLRKGRLIKEVWSYFYPPITYLSAPGRLQRLLPC